MIKKAKVVEILHDNICAKLCKMTEEDRCLSCTIYETMGKILSFKKAGNIEEEHAFKLDNKFFKCRYCINWCGGEYDEEAPCTITNKVQSKKGLCNYYTLNKRKEREWK